MMKTMNLLLPVLRSAPMIYSSHAKAGAVLLLLQSCSLTTVGLIEWFHYEIMKQIQCLLGPFSAAHHVISHTGLVTKTMFILVSLFIWWPSWQSPEVVLEFLETQPNWLIWPTHSPENPLAIGLLIAWIDWFIHSGGQSPEYLVRQIINLVCLNMQGGVAHVYSPTFRRLRLKDVGFQALFISTYQCEHHYDI